MKTRINWKPLIVILLALTTIAVTGVSLRQYHRNKRSAIGYTEGLKAFEEGRWQDAAVYLGQYLSIHQQDVSILLKYAQSNIRIQPPRRESLTQAVNAYRAILRLEDHAQAAAELAQIYLEADMPAEAELVARRFVDKSPDIRFQQYLAEALTRQRKFEEGVAVLMRLISLQPDQVLAFDLLGRIAEQRPAASRLSAQGWFDEAVEKNPQSAQAYVLRSAYWSRQGQIQPAIEDLRRAEQCPMTAARDRLSIAAAWIQQGRLDEAMIHLEKARQLEPDNLLVWQIWALWAQTANDPGRMKAVASQAMERLGWKNYSFLPIAGELFALAGEDQQAQRCLDLLKAADAERGLILYLEGLIANMRMNWAQAIDRWQQAIHLGYAEEPVYLNLAQTLDRIQNRTAAISLLRNYVSSRPGVFRGHLLLGQMLVRENRMSEAMEQATAAVQLKPSSLDAQIFYLRCRVLSVPQIKPAEWTILEKRIRELISIHDDVRTRLLLFEAALKKRDYVLAAETLEQGQARFGDDVQWVLARAELLKSQGKAEQVTAMLENELGRFPDSMELVRALAASCAADHQYDKAKTLLAERLKKAAAASERRNLRLWVAEVNFMQGRIDEAADIYRQLAQENASDVYACRQLLAITSDSAADGQILQWIGQIQQAEGEDGWQWKYEQARYLFKRQPFEISYPRIVELLEQNLIDNPDDQDSRILLASAYERADNIQLALSLYRQALAIRPDDVELVVAAVSLMYRAEEYRQAQQLLDRAIQQGVQDLRLMRFELQNSLRLGRMDAAVSSLERIILESGGDYHSRLTLSLLLIRRGDYEQAGEMIEKLMAEYPDSLAAAAAMAELHLSRSDAAGAVAVCDAFVQKHDTAQAHVLRAQVLLQTDRQAQALEEIGKLEFTAATVAEKVAVTELYRTAGKHARADEIINALLTEYPEDPSVLKQAAMILIERSDTLARGRKLLDQALAANPRDHQLRLRKAELLIFQKTADAVTEGMKILNDMVYEMPRLETAWLLLGQGAILQKDAAMAMNYITRGLANLPESRGLLLLKAQAEAMHSPLLAIGTLMEMRQQDLLDTEVLRMLSEMYRRSDQPDKAVALLDEAFQEPSVSGSQALQREWIAAAYEAGRKEEAFAYVKRKTEQSDGNEGFLSAWTGLLVQDGRWKDAVDVYENWAVQYPEKRENILPVILDQLSSTGLEDAIEAGRRMVQAVLRENPNSVTAIYSMAMLLHHSGQILQAVPWYEKTIRLNPGQVIAVNNLAWILATEKNELGQALKLTDEGVRLAPAYVDLIDTRGYVLMQMGQYEQAAAEFEKCLRMYIARNPKRTCSMFYLSRCLLELKRPDQAQIEFLKTKRLQEENGGLTPQQVQQLEASIQKLSATQVL